MTGKTPRRRPPLPSGQAITKTLLVRMTPSEHRTIAALARHQPTHKSVRPLWNASTNCVSNPVAKRSVCPISMKPTSTEIWAWATPGPQRTRMLGACVTQLRFQIALASMAPTISASDSVSSGTRAVVTTRAAVTKNTRFSSCSAWLDDEPGAVVIIWDGAAWHWAKSVQAAAAKLGPTLIPLSAYGPDLNPIENLWRWMREEVTRNHCHQSMRHLFDACKASIDRINAHPYQLVTRLWPEFELDPEHEKRLVSN